MAVYLQVIEALSAAERSGPASGLLQNLASVLSANGYCVSEMQNSRQAASVTDCLHSLRHTYLECSRPGAPPS